MPRGRVDLPAILWGITVACAVAAAPTARAEGDVWAVLALETRSISNADAEAFRTLLTARLGDETGVAFIQPEMSCGGSECAREVGAKLGAGRVVFGRLLALGTKVIANAYVVDVASGQVVQRAEMTVDRVEDLDQAATRIAAALAHGTSPGAEARFGNITAHEAQPPRRREGVRGVGVYLGGAFPVGTVMSSAPGVQVGLSYWFETERLAIEPRLGLRFSADGPGWVVFPMDIGAYYLLSTGDFAPFVGGGLGIHYAHERRPETLRVGSALTATNTEVREDGGWGLGLFGRAGLLLLRTYSVRLIASVEYGTTMVDLNGNGFAHGLDLKLGVIF